MSKGLARGAPKRLRLALGLATLVCCNSIPPPPGGLLSSPAGMALAGSLLFIANQDANELHVFDVNAQSFRPAPNFMFPLSVPTVRRPGPVCGDANQIFTMSTVDPTFGVIDAFDDNTVVDPARGMRELGEGSLPGIASDAICTQDPGAVLAHKIAVGGSPDGYFAGLGSTLVVDAPLVALPDGGLTAPGVLPDGGLDERHALAALPTVALVPINTSDNACSGGACAGTQIWEVSNDLSGQSCGTGTPAFCPSVKPLLVLPPQPASCNPVGPPLALRVDASGANAGVTNFGLPNTEPATANQLMASDRNSNCVAYINLDDLSVTWLPANGPSTGVFAAPFIPGTCLPGGEIYAAVLDSENCERSGPPPVGGYGNCNGVSFLTPGGGLLPEPLPYPFTPRRPLPPVRMPTTVTQVAFSGPNLQVGDFSTQLPNGAPVPIQELAVAGTTEGSMYYIDIGFGFADGGTGAGDAGLFACPPSYLAPRLFDVNDYISGASAPLIYDVLVVDSDGGLSLGEINTPPTNDAFTASGAPLPTADRLGNPFATPLAADGTSTPLLGCIASPTGSQICYSNGLVQKGVANDEAFSAVYEGTLEAFPGVGGTLTGLQLQIPVGDLTQIEQGLLSREKANLTVELATGGGVCGQYGIAAVAPASLQLQPGGGCPDGAVQVTIFASGAKPFTLQGTQSGFIPELWPADGSLHLVPGRRWHYPADLVGMLYAAEELADLTFGPIPAAAAPNSTLTFPRADGRDSDALDSPFSVGFFGVLGQVGVSDGGVDGGVIPLRGARWTFSVASSVLPLAVDPFDGSSLIDGMASFIDTIDGGTPHVFGAYRGGNAMVELNPDLASSQAIFEAH